MAQSHPIDLSWLAKLNTARFYPRGPVEGSLSGHHDSSRRGRAGEFVDRRAYAPGDDRRRVDWKYLARSDRWTVREERDDTRLRAVILTDVSRSMRFCGDPRPPKSDFAMGLTIGLAHVLRRGRESYGWGFFDQTLLSFQPPRFGDDPWARLLLRFQNPPTGQHTSFVQSLGSFVERDRGPGSVVVVSDFLGSLDDVFSGFRLLTTAWGDVSALQVLDPFELDLAGAGNQRFEDLESGEVLTVDPEVVREAYRKNMETRQSHLARGLAALSVDHQLCRTDRPAEEELSAFLRRRAHL